MKKIALFTVLFLVLGFGVFALNTNAQIPIGDPVGNGEETSCPMPSTIQNLELITITCMMRRISNLERHVQKLDYRVSLLERGVSPSGTNRNKDISENSTDKSWDDNNTKTISLPTTETKPVVTGSGIILDKSDIKLIQRFLKEEGSFAYPVATGNFGRLTKEALKKYQEKEGLEATGKIDDDTLEKMKAQIPTIAPSMTSAWMQAIPMPALPNTSTGTNR